MDRLMERVLKYRLVELTKETFWKEKNRGTENLNSKMDPFL